MKSLQKCLQELCVSYFPVFVLCKDVYPEHRCVLLCVFPCVLLHSQACFGGGFLQLSGVILGCNYTCLSYFFVCLFDFVSFCIQLPLNMYSSFKCQTFWSMSPQFILTTTILCVLITLSVCWPWDVKDVKTLLQNQLMSKMDYFILFYFPGKTKKFLRENPQE